MDVDNIFHNSFGFQIRYMTMATKGMPAGGHGGSHGHLCHEFVTAILEDRQPVIDVSMALNLTVAGVVAHQSALKDGERMTVPQYAPL